MKFVSLVTNYFVTIVTDMVEECCYTSGITPITLQCISAQGIANLDRTYITYLHQTQYENILHLPKYFFEAIPIARYIIPISSSAFTTVDQVGNSRFIQAMSISFLQSLVVLMSRSMVFRTGTGTRRHIPSRNQSVTPSTSLTRSFRCTSPKTKEGWGRNQGYGFQQLINYINTFVNASLARISITKNSFLHSNVYTCIQKITSGCDCIAQDHWIRNTVSVPGAVYVLNCQSNKALERTSPLGLLASPDNLIAIRLDSGNEGSELSLLLP